MRIQDDFPGEITFREAVFYFFRSKMLLEHYQGFDRSKIQVDYRQHCFELGSTRSLQKFLMAHGKIFRSAYYWAHDTFLYQC